MSLKQEVTERARAVTGMTPCRNCGAEYKHEMMYQYRTSNGQVRKLCPPCGEKRLAAIRRSKRK